jgi:hypothetical protein
MLVFFGGCDACNETAKAIAAIKSLDRHDIDVDVIVGKEISKRKPLRSCAVPIPDFIFIARWMTWPEECRTPILRLEQGDIHMGALLPWRPLDYSCGGENQAATTAAVSVRRHD